VATTADVIEANEISLRGIEKETAFLPELATRWSKLPEDIRASWELEWSELMRHLALLDDAYGSGILTAGQQVRYRKLHRKLQAALPIIAELDFERPTVRLEA